MMKAAQSFQPDGIVVMGDLADFYAVSDFSKDPARANRLDEELEDVEAGLDELDALGAVNKVFCAGNHCDRLRRFLQDNAPQLHKRLTVPKLLHLERRGWIYVPYRQDIKIGKMYFTHAVGKAGRSSVFQCADTYQHSVITGHTHRLAYVVEGDATGKAKLSAQFGWLGDVTKADYMHQIKARRDWALGFGVGYLDPTTQVVHVTPVPIVNYTCVVEGRAYRG